MTEAGSTVRYPVRRADLEARTVDEETIVLDVKESRVHRFNRSASDIWNWCDGQHSVADIAARLAAAHDLTVETVMGDVQTSLAEFDRLGLMADGNTPLSQDD